MLFKRDFSSTQFNRLRELYNEAVECLKLLNKNHPELKHVWRIAAAKMQLIEQTINSDEIPTEEKKRDADLSTMLTQELRDFPDDNETLPLYNLDKAYMLLGMKDIHIEKRDPAP